MDIVWKNELKAHILSLATHTARATLFQEIAHTREVQGYVDESRRYAQKALQETEYANRKQAFIWSMIDEKA